MDKKLIIIILMLILITGCYPFDMKMVDNCSECYNNETCIDSGGMMPTYYCISFVASFFYHNTTGNTDTFNFTCCECKL